ncbi:MAG: GAF domain-containing sensor histidine kinase [Bacteroidota bacterium]
MQSAEHELIALQNRNELIRLLSIEFSKPANLQEKLQRMLQLLDENFGLCHTLLLLPDERHEQLTLYASRGYTDKTTGISVKFGEGPAGLVAAKKRKLRLVNISRKRSYFTHEPAVVNNPLPSLPNVESLVVLPIISGNELVAVLSAESEKLDFFKPEDEDFLMTLSQLIGLSIQNSLIIDQLEQKVRQRTEALEEQKQALQQANASKDRLFAIIGHDLRSPAASLQNVGELIDFYQRKGDNDRLFELGGKIVKAARNMNSILDNLLSWSITQTGDITISPEPLDIYQLLEEILDNYADIAQSKNITLLFPPADSGKVFTDRNSLLAIFRNLLSNAIKFTRPGGEIRITVSTEDKTVLITFCDNGVGIPPEKLAELFSIRDRKSTAGTSREKGIGIGLIIVDELVRLNNGKLIAESEVGVGTKIGVRLIR